MSLRGQAVLSLTLLSTSLLFAACAEAPKEISPGQTSAPAQTAASPSSNQASTPTIAVGHGSTAPASAASTMSQGASQSDAAGDAKWTVPSRWESKPASGMRAATYLIPAASGDSEGAECAVFKNIGGGVQANIDRWVGQFEKTADAPKQKKETINGFPVTTVDLTGTFKGGGPMMSQPSGPKPNYRLLGAIVEAPEGEIFFKLTGPAKTVAAAQSEFQSLLKSLKK